MRIYTRERQPDLRAGVLGLLLSTVDTQSSQVWLIAPWLRDITLPIGDHGHFASVFGSYRDEVTLTEVLFRLRRDHEVHVVGKPLDELVPFSTVRRIVELLDDRDVLLADQEARVYESAERVLTALGDEIAALGREVTRHAETVAMLVDLAERGIAVHVVPHLHAKLLWTPAGAMVGSANFTHGGFALNEELMVEVSQPQHLADLRTAAAEIAARGTGLASQSLTRHGVTAETLRMAARRFGDELPLREAAGLLTTLEAFAE
jgi:phosphatidylserine/phosphatidylglycerophosphate/cardiolipin synthase-like enzyme